MDIFLDIGFTLMGGPNLSPPKKIKCILNLNDDCLGKLSKIIFSENHETPDSLILSLEKSFRITVADFQRDKITDFWDKQFSEVYEIKGATSLINSLHKLYQSIHIVSNLWYPFYNKFSDIFNKSLYCINTETLSFMEGITKPSTGFYEIALKRSGAIPSNSIMVGDSIDNDIIPCAKLGMKCIWFISRHINETELKKKKLNISQYNGIYKVYNLFEVQSVIKRILNEQPEKI